MKPYTSSKEIVDYIFKTLKPVDTNWLPDVFDSIGEAIAGIGYHIGLDYTSCELEVKNNRVFVPKNVVDIDLVEYNNMFLNKTATRAYDNISTSEYEYVEDPERAKELSTKVSYYEGLEASKTGASPEELLDIIEKQEYVIGEINNLAKNLYVKTPKEGTYTLNSPFFYHNGKYLHFSFSTGKIRLYYSRYLTDNDDYPMIVDSFKYKRAVRTYCMAELYLQGYAHPELSYKELLILWEDYRQQAANEGKLQDIADYEKFTRMWTRLKPDIRAAEDSFRWQET